MMPRWFALPALALLVLGCNGANTTRERVDDKPASAQPGNSVERDARAQANLAKLSPEDRKLAEEQDYCAVESDNRLGAMGTPVKVVLKDQTVFVCCKACVAEAESHPDETLARVKERKARTQSGGSR
jgi:hypothetical protein